MDVEYSNFLRRLRGYVETISSEELLEIDKIVSEELCNRRNLPPFKHVRIEKDFLRDEEGRLRIFHTLTSPSSGEVEVEQSP